MITYTYLELSRSPSFQKKIRSSFSLVTRQRDGDLCPVLRYGCLLQVELRRFPKFQVHILKTDGGGDARREGSARPTLL